MKDIIYRFCTVAVILLVVGCGEDLYDPSKEYSLSTSLRYLRVPETSFEYESSSAHQIDFVVEAMDTQWGFSNSNDWISLSPETGKETTTVTMNIQENPFGDESRIGLFELRSLETDWTYSKTLKVSQMASSPYLYVEENYLYFGGGNEQQEILIESNCNWTTSASVNWISLMKDATGNKLNISVLPNPEKNYRTGTFYIRYKNSSKQINVYQYPSTITVSDASLTFENSASELVLSLTAEADWTASTSNSWISVNPSNGTAGTHEIRISVASNASVSSRKGYVSFFTSSNQKAQIEIEQKGLYIETSVSTLSFGSKVETQSLGIISNTSWKVKSYPQWISLSDLSGSDNATIEVTTTENPTVNSRNGNIVITQEGLDISIQIEITQAGKSFYILGSFMEFPHNASSQTLKLRSELPWTSFVAGEWISTNPQSGTTDADVTVSVLENNSYDERDGTVTYMVDGKSKVLSVHQQSKYFTIEDKVFSITSKGGKINISFGTNEKWTATIENELDWLSLSSTSGEGNGNITLIVADNPSVNTRSAIVVIDTGTGRTYRISVSQAARFLKVNTQSLMFFAHGGNQNVMVDTDGNYKVRASDSWITIDNSINGVVNVAVSMNREEESRRGSLSIELTDLTEGSLTIVIPIIQLGQGASFIKEEYPIDKDWNISEKHGFELSITGFMTDKDWNSSSTSTVNLIKTGYREETDWNPSSDKTGEFSKDGYEDETNWENSSQQSATVDKSSYEDDKDWNSSSDKIGTISKDNYGNDADWSLPANQGVTISKTSYEDDKNWNN